MKHLKHTLLWLTLACWGANSSFAQTISSVSTHDNEGILFFVGNWSQTLEMASAMKKPIFAVVYKTYSPDCKSMNNSTFKDADAVNYYENNFINFKLDVHSAEGMKFMQQYKLTEYPALLYFDAAGELIGQAAGIKSTTELISLGKSASSNNHNDNALGNYNQGVPAIYTSFLDQKLQFQNGSDSPSFLYDYAYSLKKFSEPYETIVDRYIKSADFAQTTAIRNMQFVFDFADNTNSSAFDILIGNKQLYVGVFGKDPVNQKIQDAIRSEVVLAAIERDQSALDNALRYVSRAMLPDSKKLNTELRLLYFQNTKNWQSYTQTAQDYYTTENQPDTDLLNSAAQRICLASNNKEQLEKASLWIEKVLSLNNSHFEYNETYALVLYKLGKKTKAIKEVETAIEKARKNGGDYTNSLELMEIMRSDRKIPIAMK